MSTNIVYNGVTYTIPATDDVDWGEAVSNFLIAIPGGMLTKVGGAWGLTDSDLDFGASGSIYGVVAKYFKSKSATLAQSGALRLALADWIAWRSDGNDKDLVLIPNATDGLLWDNVELATISGTQTLTNKTIDTATNTITNLRDANIAADALIAWSKINFSGDFGSTSVITTGGVKLGSSFHVTLQADPSEDYDFVFPTTDGTAGQALVKATGGELEWATVPGLAIDESNVIVGGSSDTPVNVDTSAAGDILANETTGLTVKNDVLTNVMVKSDAAIALSKLAALTASRAVATDASGFISVSTVTATELGWVSGVTSGIQGQFNSITTNVLALQNIVSDSKEPMGLVVLPTPPAVTYEGSRQIKIAHPFSYYFKGNRVNSTADVTVTVPNTTGIYYIVFTNSGLTASAETTVDLLNQVIWASFYWNVSTGDYMFFEERHGLSWTANEHSQAHLTRGAAYESGGAASGYVLASDALADVQIALDATNFWDEDIRNALAAKLEGSNWDKWYRSGASGDWRKDTADTIPAFWAGTPPNGVAQINTTSGSWGLTPVTNNYYFNTYIFATNSKESANRFIIIAGQGQASTLSGAQALSVSNLALGTLPVQELLPLYKVTLRYRTVNTNNNARVTIEAVEDIRRTTSPGVSAGVSGTHNSLSGRSDADSHPTSAITGLNGEAASDTVRITVPQATLAALTALTRKKGTIVYATDTNKLYADDGAVLKVTGGGLIATPIDKDSSGTLENGKHYLLDCTSLAADKTLTLPAIAAEFNIKITVYNLPTGFKVIIAPNGSEKIFFNDTDQSTVEFIAAETEQWAEFISNSTKWIVNDAVGGMGGTWSGPLTVTGALAFPVTSLSDAQATAMGLKQYLHGTNYSGGIAPTVGGATSVTRGVFIPYQMQDGTWRLKFNISVNPGGASAVLTIVGVTFATYQAGSAYDPANNATYAVCGAINGANQLSIVSGTSTTLLVLSGDVELSAKPTWAY